MTGVEKKHERIPIVMKIPLPLPVGSHVDFM